MPLDFQIVNSDSANLWGWYKNGKDGTVFFPYNGECMTVWGLRPAPYVPPTNPETGEGEQASFTSVWSASHNGRNMAFRFNAYSKAENRAGGGAMADRVLAYGCGVRCVADAE